MSILAVKSVLQPLSK